MVEYMDMATLEFIKVINGALVHEVCTFIPDDLLPAN